MVRTKQRQRALTDRRLSFKDHAGREALCLWEKSEDEPVTSKPPYWSFQLYTTSEQVHADLSQRWPQELFMDFYPSNWRIDVYEPQPSIWACIEHQRKEREYRRTLGTTVTGDDKPPGIILKSYANREKSPTLVANAMILVIDNIDWVSQPGEPDNLPGPLLVRFLDAEAREIDETTLKAFADDQYEEYTTKEQEEFEITRLPKADWPNRDLYELERGVYDAEEERKAEEGNDHDDDDIPETIEHTPPQRKERAIGTLPISSDVQGEANTASFIRGGGNEDVLMEYIPSHSDESGVDISYMICQTSASQTSESIEEISVRLLAQILAGLNIINTGVKRIELEITKPYKDLLDVLEHFSSIPIDRDIGYLNENTGKERQFPRHNFTADNLRAWKVGSSHKQFLIVLDKQDWENEGVLFVWNEAIEQQKIRENLVVASRIHGGLKFIVQRLAGIL